MTHDRRAEILRHISKQQKGIEIGPFFAPLAPKRDGYQCLSLDVFDADRLRTIAQDDPNIPRDQLGGIEAVDIVGSTSDIERLIDARRELGTFDYIVSSHNFEHIPNPIKFLHGCGVVLKPGGVLSMAIPDKRTCFDYFRPLTTISPWIEAFMAGRMRPTLSQNFENGALDARLAQDGRLLASFPVPQDPRCVSLIGDLRKSYEVWMARAKSGETDYHDSHCWAFTPSSFSLLIQEARYLRLCPLSVEHVSGTHAHEFFVHLRNVGHAAQDAVDASAFNAIRQALLHRMGEELAAPSLALLMGPEDIAGRRARTRFLMRRMGRDALSICRMIVDFLRGRR
jgi:SAM-dependent methyltransferase